MGVVLTSHASYGALGLQISLDIPVEPGEGHSILPVKHINFGELSLELFAQWLRCHCYKSMVFQPKMRMEMLELPDVCSIVVLIFELCPV